MSVNNATVGPLPKGKKSGAGKNFFEARTPLLI